MSRLPTAAALIERLRDLYEAQLGEKLSDERLAAQLKFGLSTLHRWKKEDTEQFALIVKMLDEAGWLNTTADGRVIEESAPRPLPMVLEELALGQAALLKHFGLQIPDVQPAESPAPPKDSKNRRKNGSR